MQYIPKLAMSQSQKPRSHSIMYSIDAPVRPVKILFTKYCWHALGRMHSPVRSLWTFNYISIYSCLFALKPPFKSTYMEMKIFENIFPPHEDLQTLRMLFTSHITSHTTPLVMSNALNSCLEFATLKRGTISLYLCVQYWDITEGPAQRPYI
jgi:hypothetical protein